MPASFKVTKYGIIGNLTGSVQGTASYAITASYVPGIPDVSIFVASASYSTSDKKIYFYSSTGSQLAFIDATDFIKDGMVDTVTINTGSNQMIITFNTDAGKEDIELSLTDIFNPSNYYDKDDVDLIISGLPRGIEAITFNDTPASVSDGTASISYAFVEEDPIYLADSASLKASASVATSASEWITANSGNLGKSPFIPGEGSGSAVLSGSGAQATGEFAVAEGTYTKALGNSSHAEGQSTEASGSYSHAEGRLAKASGSYSHAEGYYTNALGNSSHAEGDYTNALGNYSHAEGANTKASGTRSHAEGESTEAKGYASHAEGQGTIAFGTGSHAEGVEYNNTGTRAEADAAHAEGAGVVVKGQAAHGEGLLNVVGRTQEEAVAALADFPNLSGTTEQKISKLIGFAAHSEGSSTQALGTSSHTEGNSTKALVNATHAEGDSTTASGEAAHSEGCNTVASGNQAHAEGYNTEASANQAHAEGKQTKATSENAHAEGNHTTANGNASHTEGYYTVANNNVEHAEGQYNVSNKASTTFGNAGNTIHSVGIGGTSLNRNAFEIMQNGDAYLIGVGGYNGTNPAAATDLATLLNSSSIWIKGEGSGSAVLSGSGATATGQFAVAEGGLTVASGSCSHAEGGSTKALGGCSHAEGDDTRASGSYSHAEGTVTTALGNYSHAEGIVTKASGAGSHAEGNNTLASGRCSHVEGLYTTASNEYEHAQGKYNATASGQIFSVGTGDNNSRRKNAISIITGSSPSASVYIYGVGTYDGTNPTPGVNDLATVISASAEGSALILDISPYENTWTEDEDEGYLTVPVDFYTQALEALTAGKEVYLFESWQDTSTGEKGAVLSQAYRAVYHPDNVGAQAVNNWIGFGGNVDESNSNAIQSISLHGDGKVFFRYTYIPKASQVQSWDSAVSWLSANSASLVTESLWIGGTGTGSTILGPMHPSGAQATGRYAVINGSYESETEYGITSYYPIVASGDFSHAEGFKTKAQGRYSHAEGENAVTFGSSTHAEGYFTEASGSNSHAEGYYTRTTGSYSHAEGANTQAIGAHSHAEGTGTTAIGEASHAEGSRTIASGSYSHAEGLYTTASGLGAHAEGTASIALGRSSHAEGWDTVARASGSHAEGTGSVASGSCSHAEGHFTVAKSNASHAEGSRTIASGSYSHAEGLYTIALGAYSHAEGSGSIASGSWSHAEGRGTKAIGAYSHAEGWISEASGEGSYAAGYSVYATNPYEFSVGRPNFTSSKQIFSVGVGQPRAFGPGVNAISVITGSNPSASIYIYGVGSYRGTNPQPGTNDIASVIKQISASIGSGSGITSESDPIYLADSASLKASASVATSASEWITANSGNLHTHSNKGLLDSIDDTAVNSWDDAAESAHTHSNAALLNSLTNTKTGSWDSAVTSATALNSISASLIASGTLAKNVTAITASLIASASVAKSASQSAAAISAKTGSYDALVGLPTVSSADNGKILRVVSGSWALVDPVTVYSGQGAPDSTLGQDGDIYLQS